MPSDFSNVFRELHHIGLVFSSISIVFGIVTTTVVGGLVYVGSLLHRKYRTEIEQHYQLAHSARGEIARLSRVIDRIRSANVAPQDVLNRPRRPDERAQEAQILDASFAINKRLERLRHQLEQVVDLRSQLLATYPSKRVLIDDAFNQFTKATDKIYVAAKLRFDTSRQNIERELLAEWDQALFANHGSNDKVTKRLREAERLMEKVAQSENWFAEVVAWTGRRFTIRRPTSARIILRCNKDFWSD